MANAQDISVIIPAYNAAPTLAKCLTALTSQTSPPGEIVVVDDGSTDATRQVAEGFGVKVIANSRGKGAGGARNSGAAAAAGKVLAFTDSDCVPPANWLENIAAALNEPETLGVAGGYCRHVGESFIGWFAFLELRLRRRDFPRHVATAVSNNFAVRAEAFHQAGGFPEKFSGATAEDLMLSYQIGRLGPIVWLHDNGVGHHFHESVGRYLRQQHAFARDALVAYFSLPGMRQIKTFHGRLIYLQTFLAGLFLPALIVPQAALVLLLALWVLDLPLLAQIYHSRGAREALLAFGFIPIRDLNWARGIVCGLWQVINTQAKRDVRGQHTPFS